MIRNGDPTPGGGNRPQPSEYRRGPDRTSIRQEACAILAEKNLALGSDVMIETPSVRRHSRGPTSSSEGPFFVLRIHKCREARSGNASTGQGACRTTCSVVLPRNASRKPCCPAVGMAMS